MTTPGPLATHHALITGGGRGIGRAIALAFAQAGATVTVSARTTTEINAVAAELRALGATAFAHPCDVTDPAQVTALLAAITAAAGTGAHPAAARPAVSGVSGAPDILVNNAGAAGSHKFLNHDDALWHQMLAVNLTSAYYLSKACVPAMLSGGWGRIINIASIAAKVGGRYIAAYTASKHGLLGLTRALAVEFAAQGITVNAICPGYVDTAMTDLAVATITARTKLNADDARQTLARVSPQNRLITAAEVAHVALMLAHPDAHGITGQAISVDGGTVMT